MNAAASAGPVRRALNATLGWPWYPSLATLGFVLLVFADYPILVTSGLRAFAVAFGAGVVVTIIGTVPYGRDRAGVAASLVLAALIGGTGVLGAALITTALVLLWVEKRWVEREQMHLRVPWRKVTEIANILAVAFVALQVGRATIVRLPGNSPETPVSWTVPGGAPRPDLFVILADGHGRADVLADRYGYDPSSFAAAMKAAGFLESTASAANHSVTRFSMSVLLNGRPLAEMGQDMSKPADGQVAFLSVLANSGITMLEAAGYDTTVISSGFDHIPLHAVDHHIDVGPRNEFEQALWGNTAIGRVLDGATDAYAAGKRSRVLLEFEALRSVAQAPSHEPLFVLAHLSAPHFPMVLNSDCSLRPGDEYTLGSQGRDGRRGDETAVQIQADQTRCIDTLLIDAAEDLVASRPNAVILVLSDHGPEELLDLTQPDADGVNDRLANLFWARTPGHVNVFPNDVTLVNVLPLFANVYLGTSIQTHPDDLYYGPTGEGGGFVRFEPDAPYP